MSAASYREATRPEVLQRWHGRLNEATASGDIVALEALTGEIADALDHATDWAPMADPLDVDGPIDEANGAFLAVCALCPTDLAPTAHGPNEYVARGALGEHTERAHGRPPWPTIQEKR